MNWANRITLSRLALTVVFVVALNSSWQYARTAALIIFLIAGLTDFIDGEIARRYGVITNFGKLMDPLVDKIMMAAAFISLVPLKAVPAWAATTVVARDFLITGLRLMASAKGRILPAERLGKQKTSADNHYYFLSRSPFDGGTAIRERDVDVVGASLDRSRAGTRVDYRGADDLLGSWLHLAKSRATCARSIAAEENRERGLIDAPLLRQLNCRKSLPFKEAT